MKLMKEFKEFAMRGNVVDMAVGIIIGGAFGKIVSSMVNDLIMPPLSLFTTDRFSEAGVTLRDAAADTGDVVWRIGAFFQTCVDFVIVAFAIFMLVKVMNYVMAKKKEQEQVKPPAPAEPSREEILLMEIRDAIRSRHVAAHFDGAFGPTREQRAA